MLKQSVPKDELVIFEMTDKEMNNLIWLKKNEFNLHGNLFDVVRAHRTNDNKMYMECISDKKESDLFKNLGQNITNNLADENNSNPISSLTKIIQIPAISESLKIEVYLEKSILENTVRSFFSYSKNTSSLSKVVDSPPPQLVS